MSRTFAQSIDKTTGEPTGYQPLIATDRTFADRWQKVESFEIDDPTAKEPFSFVLCDKMFWSKELAEHVIVEYKKFMLLCSMFPERNITPSVDIDTVWHLHLLYTRSYFRFCNDALGCAFLHHEPSKGGDEQESFHENSYDKTLQTYSEVFGYEAPESVWGCRVRKM